MQAGNEIEDKAIKTSAIASTLFGVFAIALGYISGAQIMLLDGVFSFIGLLTSLATLRAARFMRKTDDTRFPFGKEAIQPLVVGIQYLLLAAMVLFALVSAIGDLFAGGNAVNSGFGILYGFLTAAGSFLVYLYIKRRSAGVNSGFIGAEINQWRLDGMLSLGILAGFGLAFVLGYTPLSDLTVYADPVMVILVSAYFLKVPLGEIGKVGRELLGMAPEEKSLVRDVETVVREVEGEYGFEESFVRVTKIGGTLEIEIHYIVGDTARVQDVRGFDQVREHVFDRLDMVDLTKWLTVSFTADRKWAE